MLDIATTIPDVKPDGNNIRTWKFFVDEINNTWRKGAADFIACGQYLIEAEQELSRDAYAAMVKTKLAFARSVAVKLTKIAANPILCAHVHNLPPCWSTLYELSQLKADVLKAALDSGSVHPGMQRKDATALKPKSNSKSTTSSSEVPSPDLSTAWGAASADQRRRFLDQLGRDELCAAMSSELQVHFRDGFIGITIAGASKTSTFAVYATNMLHSALRCAEQPDDDSEALQRMAATLTCIIRMADAKRITRSDIVIAEGRSKNRKR
jgi:hypothetical protein